MNRFPLTKRERAQLKEIEEAFAVSDKISVPSDEVARCNDMIQLLIDTGYIEKIDVNNVNAYKRLGMWDDFYKWLDDQEQKVKRLSRREWIIAIVSAIIGAVIGLVPTILSVF